MSDLARVVLDTLQWAILGYFLLVNGCLTALLVAAAREQRMGRLESDFEDRDRLLASEVAPRISILAPAYCEEVTVVESVRSLLGLHYAEVEVVLINDGSPDGTLAALDAAFDLVPVDHQAIRLRLETQEIRGLLRSSRTPSLVVVDKGNGGKADALNVGLLVASGELVCAIDADTLVEPDALLRMVRPFLQDDRVVASGGTIRAVNGSDVRAGRVTRQRAPRGLLPGLQATEYLRAFLAGRLGWNRLGGNLVISGAFGLFRREEMIEAGGYRHDTVGEDMEVVVRLRRAGIEQRRASRVVFVPDPVAWTEVPDSLRVLARQRDRWHRGLLDVLWRHRKLLGNPRYGVLGLVVVPYFWIVELIAPIIELVGIASLLIGLPLGMVNVEFAVLFLLVAYGYGLVLTSATICLEEWGTRGYGGLRDRLVLLGFGVIDGLGYRQLTAVWRVRGIVRFLRGHSDWGVMTRSGFAGALPAGEADPDPEASRTA